MVLMDVFTFQGVSAVFSPFVTLAGSQLMLQMLDSIVRRLRYVHEFDSQHGKTSSFIQVSPPAKTDRPDSD